MASVARPSILEVRSDGLPRCARSDGRDGLPRFARSDAKFMNRSDGQV